MNIINFQQKVAVNVIGLDQGLARGVAVVNWSGHVLFSSSNGTLEVGCGVRDQDIEVELTEKPLHHEKTVQNSLKFSIRNALVKKMHHSDDSVRGLSLSKIKRITVNLKSGESIVEFAVVT